MLTGVHFLLTYSCTRECDHCFLFCSPQAKGTFTLEFLEESFRQIAEADSINSVYFEGGEPFLYYPLLVEGVRLARGAGLSVGIVSNAFWANSVADARLYLTPLAELGIDDLSISDDTYHEDESGIRRAAHAREAAAQLGMPADTICIDEPTVGETAYDGVRGAAVVGGSVRFRGRAVETLLDNLPRQPASCFAECPHEDFVDPKRVHLDPYGNLHLCQGLLIGNIRERSLAEILRTYNREIHPIIGPLDVGGPHRLAQIADIPTMDGFVDACHLCYEARKTLRPHYPATLAPAQVYGETH